MEHFILLLFHSAHYNKSGEYKYGIDKLIDDEMKFTSLITYLIKI